jgi:hypothetical protein
MMHITPFTRRRRSWLDAAARVFDVCLGLLILVGTGAIAGATGAALTLMLMRSAL